MNPILSSLFVALLSTALLLTLAACDVAGTDRTEQPMRSAVDVAKTTGNGAVADTKVSGASAAVVNDDASAKVAQDPRIDDRLIAAKVTTGLAADKNLSALKIMVDAREGVVTLRGPAPSAAARARAEEIARNVQGVTSVNNQLSLQAG